MSSSTVNMGLVKWGVNDNFSHIDLANNWTTIDGHDHSSGKGVQITSSGIAPLAVGTNQIQNSSVTSTKLVSNGITGDRIQDGSLPGGKISPGSITTTQIGQLPQCRAYSSSAFAIPNTTVTPIQFTATYLNTPSTIWGNAHPTRLVAPASGIYFVGGIVTWATSASGAIRRLEIRRNGAEIAAANDVTGSFSSFTWQHVTTMLALSANDYIEILAYQDSGGVINLTVNANQDAPEARLVWLSS